MNAHPLADLVRRLAERVPGRSEATLQADIRMLLLSEHLNLSDADVRDVPLEAPTVRGKRIDIEVGSTVVEVKRDLRAGTVRADAVEQLTGYVHERTQATGSRYVGILTDGAEWSMYVLGPDGALHEVSRYEVAAGGVADVHALTNWLEGAVASRSGIQPTPAAIEELLGAQSPAHQLDFGSLLQLYKANKRNPTVELKRQLWGRLLTTAQGTQFEDTDELFVNHTLLVLIGDVVAHAVVGFDPGNPALAPATIVTGGLFTNAQINGVVEADFFEWVLEVEGGEAFVRSLARRIARFDWEDAQHDVMKVLYESIIGPAERHSLGEYYTPDWIAEKMIGQVVADPLEQRVLDPACGSGTFVFHAVRHYLAAADAVGADVGTAITGATEHVIGLDVHPVAVSLARVTYLLAIGKDRLQSDERPAFSVPVYLGDSLQWGQQHDILSAGALTVPTDDGLQLFASELRFPERLVADATQFDRLVAELARRSADRRPGTPPPPLSAVHALFGVHPDDQPVLEATFSVMCELHDQGRDHIWGYYVRNLVRPVWLSESENQVDIIIGNPPWLAYQFMTPAMQVAYRRMSEERGLWSGGTAAPHQDLADLFVVRCAELYLRDDRELAFVMPYATLSRRQFVGFRTGRFEALLRQANVAFGRSWSLREVRPHPFPVPACVVFGKRDRTPSALEPLALEHEGRLPARNVTLDVARPLLMVSEVPITELGEIESEYHARFSQGATLVPRGLLFVEEVPAGPLGAGAGRVRVQGIHLPQEKEPWKSQPRLVGSVEAQFVRKVHLGSTLLPFRMLDPLQAVLPINGGEILAGDDFRIELFGGLAEYWRTAEQVWMTHRRSERLTLVERVNYRSDLTGQVPTPPHRVVYAKAGNTLTAARISDPTVLVDHKLYWASTTGDEALYLAAIFNSNVVNELVQPLQALGAFGPRDVDKAVFQLAIPIFEGTNPDHQELVGLAREAEDCALRVDVGGLGFQRARRLVRGALAAAGIYEPLDRAVTAVVIP